MSASVGTTVAVNEYNVPVSPVAGPAIATASGAIGSKAPISGAAPWGRGVWTRSSSTPATAAPASMAGEPAASRKSPAAGFTKSGSALRLWVPVVAVLLAGSKSLVIGTLEYRL